METTTRSERTEALDRFAQATPQMAQADQNFPVATINSQPPAIIGSQPIAGVRREQRRVLAEIKELAAMAGSDWFYRFPVKNRRTGETEWIEGPSIKLAMGVMGIVGNIEVDVRVQDYGSTFMIYARAIDLEKGSAVTRAFQQSKSAAKIGGSDDSRRNDMALQIGQSKAIRNAICGLLETYTDFGFEEARMSLVKKIGGDLDRYRQVTADRIGAKVDLKRVEAVVGRTAQQWLAPDVARIIAMGKACEDGMASWDETFPPLPGDEKTVEEKVTSFADEKAMVNDEVGAAAPITGTPAGGTSEASAGGNRTNPTAPADAQRTAIATALRMAGNAALSEHEKLEQLEQMEPMLIDEDIPASFVKTVLKHAADVARGKLTSADARRYLEGMVK